MRSYSCFIEGNGNQWEALCFDLDIAVCGQSLEEVKSSLLSAVSAYIEEAGKEAPEVRAKLLSRRAPWWVKARFALKIALHSLWRSNPHDESFEGRFSLPCQA